MKVKILKIENYRYGAITEIAKKFNCHRQAIYMALNFQTNTPLAELIRAEAINVYGGRVNTYKVDTLTARKWKHTPTTHG